MVTLREWQQTLKPKRDILYNCSVQDGSDGWVPFPIGMGYKLNDYSGNFEDIQLGSHNQTVFCAINTTTDNLRRARTGKVNRAMIVQSLQRNGIKNTYVEANQYFCELPKYKFVISPEGNGIDCHRHYEALMAGCIPIVEYHPGIDQKYYGCPILWTRDYSEINCDNLDRIYQEMIDRDYDFSRLFMRYYSQDLQQQIRSNGNYWGMRLTGRGWYT
jgi:hypothetical protein